ncbi:hypothetical protein PENSPDRAFT_760185 [Peniophora sp. CONT]|nr:hypothetical protein PENSPDRAFT_760185 [Peniophora sp. CONT]
MEDPRILHRIIRQLAGWAVYSFFAEVRVIGGDNVPREGPLIATATHHNMMLDPAVLSSTFPHQRILHYWSKSTLFINPVVRYVLVSTCNIPVDRKTKDRRKLLQGTIEALAAGASVGLFPEGTSYTEPRIMQVKDGASYAALEYAKWAIENPSKASEHPVVIVPSAIVYTNKSKYRSSVIVHYGDPISMEPYMKQYLSTEEGQPRLAAKRLTQKIEAELVEKTLNAPDWDTLYAARMARDLLWPDESSLALEHYVPVSQTLVDLFSTPDPTTDFKHVKHALLEYYALLQSTHLTNAVLASLPLPKTLDPSRPVPLPGRLKTVLVLLRDTLSSLVLLPFFVLPLCIHAPAYVMGRLGARLVEDEEETQAQNKVIFGLLCVLLAYPTAFSLLWAFLYYSPIGALISLGLVSLMAYYHTILVKDAYMRIKRIQATWRVLLGIWAPKRWEYSIAALQQYTATPKPPPNPWINKGTSTPTGSPKVEARVPSTMHSGVPDEPPVQSRRRRPRSGRVMRHVLRARAEAASALATFFGTLDRSPAVRVRASAHLARAYGGTVDAPPVEEAPDGVAPSPGPTGWRSAREVVMFLREHGAKVASLSNGIEADWALLNSDGELSSADLYDSEREGSPRSFSSPLK